MGKEIICIMKFCLPAEIDIPEHLKQYITHKSFLDEGRSHVHYLIATDSTCNRNVEDLKRDVLNEVKKLNPFWMEGFCDLEFIKWEDWGKIN